MQLILAQADRDEAILDLYKKLGQAYGFMTQDDTLLKISPIRIIFGQISQQTLEYANFIRDYSEQKFCWESSERTPSRKQTIRYHSVTKCWMHSCKISAAKLLAT